MGYEEEIMSLKKKIQGDILKLFERKNSTVKTKSITFDIPYWFNLDQRYNVKEIYNDGTMDCTDNDGELKKMKMTDMTIEQMVGLKLIITEIGPITYRF